MTTSFPPAKEWGWSQQANSQILDSRSPRKQAEVGIKSGHQRRISAISEQSPPRSALELLDPPGPIA